MAKQTQKTKRPGKAPLLKTAPPPEAPPSDKDEMLMMDSKPFTDSLKRISEQAKDWGYMARPMQVSEASASTPRLDDIHGLIRDKIAESEPAEDEASLEQEIIAAHMPPSSNWAKWVCVLSVITLIFTVAQTVLLQRQAVQLHEAQIDRMTTSFEQLHIVVNSLKEELKKKSQPPGAALPIAKLQPKPAIGPAIAPAPMGPQPPKAMAKLPGRPHASNKAAPSGDLK